MKARATRCLAFVNLENALFGRSPSFRAIADHLGLQYPGQAQRCVESLIRSGHLQRQGHCIPRSRYPAVKIVRRAA